MTGRLLTSLPFHQNTCTSNGHHHWYTTHLDHIPQLKPLQYFQFTQKLPPIAVQEPILEMSQICNPHQFSISRKKPAFLISLLFLFSSICQLPSSYMCVSMWRHEVEQRGGISHAGYTLVGKLSVYPPCSQQSRWQPCLLSVCKLDTLSLLLSGQQVSIQSV